ncbi:hypothetical protein FO519_007078 [Halicephalobus sp. NKZ332]|nr:hypothetical protein FO519_007078 [Halicephalobus sp. NKZ332]
MNDALDAMNKLKSFVNLPMGVIVPGYAGTPEEGLAHLKILLGNDTRLAFPDLPTALQTAPDLITSIYPCQLPPACSALVFIEEATVAIGSESKLSFLQLAAKLAASLDSYSDTQRFAIALYGKNIIHDIELQNYDSFNATLDALIKSMESDDFPDSGQTYLAPILDQLVSVSKEGLETNFTVILIAETEAIKDPTSAYASAQQVAAAGIDIYVIDKTRFSVPSSLFSTLTNGLPGHVLNGTFTDPLDLFPQLSQTALISTASTCPAYIFMGENSVPTCDQHVTFLKVAKDTVSNFGNGNSFAARGFGSADNWYSLSYTDKYKFIQTMQEWINDYTNGKCSDPEDVNYTAPFTDIINHLNSGYSGYGIFLEGETDTIVDLASAMGLAQQIASYNAHIYVWDISVNNNNNSLFETLTGGKPGHILRGANLTYDDVMQYVYCTVYPDFISFSCNSQTATPAPTTSCPSPSPLPQSTVTSLSTGTPWPFTNTTASGTPVVTPSGTPPSTNTSCTSLELIFILQRSGSTVPVIYENNVTQFVIDLANQFSFANEVSSGNGYARFGLIQFADNAEVSIPLANYSRSDFNNQVKQKVVIGSGGLNNVIDALLAAYNEFQSHSILSNKAIMLVIDDISAVMMNDSLDAMAKLRTLVPLPMGVIVPGYAGTPEEGLAHLKILLGNNTRLAFPDLSTALQNAPGLISTTYPCQVPPACSVICFIEEATIAIGNTAKLNFLQLVQRLVNTVVFNPNQRFSLSFFGGKILKGIEPQVFSDFNATLSAFIDTIAHDDYPTSGTTILAPILLNYTDVCRSGLYRNFSALLISETEAIRDPTDAFQACQTVASLNTDFYVIDQSKFTGPSSLFPTCTGNKPGHVLNGTSLSQDQLFNQLRDSLIQNFNSMTC